ncbi:hypothetical protein [Nocardioides sambongensis]|uniref:hypothetical protein n=1 Tax=Nocardioides sambongensis TaxID=2589074 RepID=UPI00112B71E8|nr:hypothetical protein [Nocardioides sambongensis]
MSHPHEHLGPETAREDEATARSGFHPVNIGHLVMGVAFLGLTVVWALLVCDTVEAVDAHWLLPIPWLAAGAVGLVATVFRGGRRRHRP